MDVATPKSHSLAPLLGQRAAKWASPTRTIEEHDERKKTRVIDSIHSNIHREESYQNKKDLEELAMGKIRISSIAARAGSRIPVNSNISTIGYQRRVLSPRRSLSKSSPQPTILDTTHLPLLFERSPRQTYIELRPREPRRANGSSMSKDEITRAMSRVHAKRAASLAKTYTIDGSPCSLINFNSHLKDEEVDKLNVCVCPRGSITFVDEGCVRGDVLATILREFEKVPDAELLYESSRCLSPNHISISTSNYSRGNSRNVPVRPNAQLGFSTMSIKPFFGESVYLDHSGSRHKVRDVFQ